MNSIKNRLKTIFVLTLLITFFSCEKNDPIIPNQEELITTLIYTLSPVAGGDDVILKFQDIDGDGGNAPTITADTLATNTTYNANIRLLNESENPAEEITDEINEEKEEHQFFFSKLSGLSTLEINYHNDDVDANSNPVGLSTIVTTNDTSSGQLQITLRHLPNKTAANVSDGEITNAGGETDIEVDFNVVIE